MKHDLDKLGITRSSCIAAINGDIGEISYAFSWSSSKQGHKYWCDIRRSKILPQEAKEYIQSLITQWDNENPVTCTQEDKIAGNWVICLYTYGSQFTQGKAYQIVSGNGYSGVSIALDDNSNTSNGLPKSLFRNANPWEIPLTEVEKQRKEIENAWNGEEGHRSNIQYKAVSYTHLTLPTTPYV